MLASAYILFVILILLYSVVKTLGNKGPNMDMDFNLYSEFRGLKIDEKKDINILLLGETGIGKSTFINAVANYLTFPSLEKAKQEKPMILIPCQFYIDNDLIEVGKDKNETLEVGASGTQGVKTYVFPIGTGGTKLRMIDSPGMGDTRGLDQDKENFDNILAYISQLQELHAICCMFSPKNTRITAFFDYCLKEILSRLDKKASRNLIFIFTNSRATNFTPGETYPILQKIIAEIKATTSGVDIKLSSENTFCFENDAFKYLAAVQNGKTFATSSERNYVESWRHSSRECWRLISYILGDDKQKPLPPHPIKTMVSINEARRLITSLSQPLADISELVQDNIRILERHQRNLAIQNQSIDDLKRELHVPAVDLKVTHLTQPVTVCASNKCAKLYIVNQRKKWDYVTKCHDPCYLTGISKEQIGHPGLVNCHCIDRSTNLCINCTCDFSAHMHIYYFTKTVDVTFEDKIVKANITTKEELMRQLKKILRETEDRKAEYELERENIIKYTAMFAHFLQNNAITPINDGYEKYLKYLIEREKNMGRQASQEDIDGLELLLRKYQEAKRSFDQALQLQKTIGSEINLDSSITPKKILETVDKLYSLKHTGKKIKELVQSQKTSRKKEHDSTMEYVHPAFSWDPMKVAEDKKVKKGDDKKQCKKSEDNSKKAYQKNSQKATHVQQQSNRGRNQQRGNFHNANRSSSQHRTDRFQGNSSNYPPPPPYDACYNSNPSQQQHGQYQPHTPNYQHQAPAFTPQYSAHHHSPVHHQPPHHHQQQSPYYNQHHQDSASYHVNTPNPKVEVKIFPNQPSAGHASPSHCSCPQCHPMPATSHNQGSCPCPQCSPPQFHPPAHHNTTNYHHNPNPPHYPPAQQPPQRPHNYQAPHYPPAQQPPQRPHNYQAPSGYQQYHSNSSRGFAKAAQGQNRGQGPRRVNPNTFKKRKPSDRKKGGQNTDNTSADEGSDYSTN